MSAQNTHQYDPTNITKLKEDFVVFEFPFTAELKTLVAKDNNGLYYARLVAASMAAVSVQFDFVGFI